MQDLDRILAPVTWDEYVREYWHRKFVHVPGPADKFAHLFSWEVLNRALEDHRFEADRLRLIRRGEPVERKRYMNGECVEASGLTHELANGAALVMNCCEEFHRPLRDISIELERLLHQRLNVNLYAGWRHDHGFGVHWDDHQAVILQIAGRKHWKIWKPTRDFPLKRDVVETDESTAPPGEPMCDMVLEPGGLLSIPRGWWHVAIPMGEPCMHLTFSMPRAHGVNLLTWFAENIMKNSATARMDLPVTATAEEKQAWQDQIKRDLDAAWSDDLVDRFLGNNDGGVRVRPSLSLPDTGAGAPGNEGVSADWIQRRVWRELHFDFQGDEAWCTANGMRWKLDPETAHRMERLNDGRAHRTEDICSPGSRLAVTAMVMGGILRYAAPRQ